MRMTGPTLGTLALALFMVPNARGSERPTFDAGLTLGIRWTSRDGWDEFWRQQSLGTELSWRRPTWPLFLALDLHAGGKTNSEYDPVIKRTVYTNDGTHFEAALGLRWIHASPRFVASLGSGLAYAYGGYAKDTIRVDPGQGLPDESGSGVGPWLGAGARVRVGSWYSTGVGARITWARGTMYGREVDVGGWQAYITVLAATLPRLSGGGRSPP